MHRGLPADCPPSQSDEGGGASSMSEDKENTSYEAAAAEGGTRRLEPLPPHPRVLALFINVLHRNPFGWQLEVNARDNPDQECVVWLNAEGQPVKSLSYEDLLLSVKQLSITLLQHLGVRQGERVVLCYSPGLDFIVAFFACITSGIVAVPVYPPDLAKGTADVSRFCDIKDAAGADVVLSNNYYIRMVSLFGKIVRDSRWTKVRWVSTDKDYGVSRAKAAEYRFCELPVDAIAFLQFTSGSTSQPKGVIVTHMSLLHNCFACIRIFGFPNHLDRLAAERRARMNNQPIPTFDLSSPDFSIVDFEFLSSFEFWERRHRASKSVFNHRMRVFSWLPVYHDMGLIGFVCAPMLFGATLYQMSPLDFIRRPHIWLKAMSDHQCVCSAAPNFAYEIACRRTPDDVYDQLELSHVCGLLCGAEPIRAATVKRFLEKFGPKGISPNVFLPAYGMAENTLVITGRGTFEDEPLILPVASDVLRRTGRVEICKDSPQSDPGRVQHLVGVGKPCPWMDVRVVDPETGVEQPDGRSGEIWIAGASLSPGYYNLPDKTAESFRFRCFLREEKKWSSDCYLKTGDAGFIYQEQLFISGRIKDVIIIRGRNYYPQDVEECVDCVTSVRPGSGAAFAMDIEKAGGTEEVLGVVVELREIIEDRSIKGLLSKIGLGGSSGLSSTAIAAYEAIARDISREVMKAVGVPVYKLWLVRPREVPKTSSGKIRRSAARDKALSGTWGAVVYESIMHGGAEATSIAVPAASLERRAVVIAQPDTPMDNISEEYQSVLDEDDHGAFASSATRHPREPKASTVLAAASESHVQNIARVKRAVLNSARIVLGTDEVPDGNLPLHELGVDSIGAVEFSELVATELDLEIEPTLVFNYPTINDIMDFLVAELDGRDEQKLVGLYQSVAGRRGDPSLAVISTSCALPGNCQSLDAFWSTLTAKTDCITEVPCSRWDVDDYYDPDPDSEGKMYIKEGGFIENADLFDAAFFRISPSEARSMDPQQRLLMQAAYEALHAAGYRKEALQRAPIGVIVGCCSYDWVYISQKHQQGRASSYSATSQAASILSNRISYALGMTGPSLTVDTACSSSLVAVHIAGHELATGTCTAAVVGGVNLILAPEATVAFCKARMMATDARCKTFDASANGYVRGEGIGVIVLKTRGQAQTDGDTPLGFIRSSAINHGGRAASLTAPNGPSQQRVINMALQRGQLVPSDLSFIETHGTGTSLGDPIEVGALKTVFASGRPTTSPLILGAVKTNIGHLEGAAGMAGLLKALLVLKHGEVPPNLHFRVLNPHIDVKGFPIVVPTISIPLPTTDAGKCAFAGVSSFGFGGANAHVILEAAPSASDGPLSLTGTEAPIEEEEPTVAFLFSGQGSQYVNMGRYYFDTESVFRSVVLKCDELLRPFLPCSLLSVLYPSDSGSESTAPVALDSALLAEVALFTVQYAMAELWQSRGVHPDVVLGVGAGEFVAATVAGVVGFEEALQLVAQKAKMVSALPENTGVMIACRASADDVEISIAEMGPELLQSVVVAVDYGPRSIVLSGEKAEIEKVIMFLRHSGIQCHPRPLRVSHAFQSPALAPVVGPLRQLLAGCDLSPPKIPIVTATTGELLEPEEATNPRRWAQQVVSPLRFGESIRTVVAMGCRLLIELGPRPILHQMATQNVNSENVRWLASMCPARDGPDDEGETTNPLLRSPRTKRSQQQGSSPPQRNECVEAGLIDEGLTAYRDLSGTDIHNTRNRGRRRQRKGLSHQRVDGLFCPQSFPWTEIPHPFISDKYEHRTANATIFQVKFPRRALHLFFDHCVNGSAVLPGAAFFEILASAASFLNLRNSSNAVQIEDVVFETPMLLGSHRVTYEFEQRVVVSAAAGGLSTPTVTRTPKRVNELLRLVRTPSAGGAGVGPSQSSTLHLSSVTTPTLPQITEEPGELDTSAQPSPRNLLERVVEMNTSQTQTEQGRPAGRPLLSQPSTQQYLPQATVPTATVVIRIGTDRQATVGSFHGDDSSEETVHCFGKLSVCSEEALLDCQPAEDIFDLRARCPIPMDVVAIYSHLAKLGLQYGPRFQTMREVYIGTDQVVSLLSLLPIELSTTRHSKVDPFETGFMLHPAILDGAVQSAAALLGAATGKGPKALVPFSVKRVTVAKSQPAMECWSHLTLVEKGQKKVVVNVVIYNSSDSQAVAVLDELTLRESNIGNQTLAAEIPRELLWEMAWEPRSTQPQKPSSPVSAPQPLRQPGTALLIGIPDTLQSCVDGSLEPELRECGITEFVYISLKDMLEKDLPAMRQQLRSQDWSAIIFVAPLFTDHACPCYEDSVRILDAAIVLLQAAMNCARSNDFRSLIVFVTTQCQMLSPIDCPQFPPLYASLWGVCRSARLEFEAVSPGAVQLLCLDIDFPTDITGRSGKSPIVHQLALQLAPVLRKISVGPFENEIVIRGAASAEYVPRLKKSARRVLGPIELHLSERGTVSNLVLRPQSFASRVPPETGKKQVEVRVRAVGLNFRDVLNVMGLYPGDPGPPGGDFAGTVVAVGDDVQGLEVGQNIFGIAPGCLKTYVTTDAELVRPIPNGMSFEAAAALPVIAVTVEYSLAELAKVKSGDRVLIHAASGGVGLMAIQHCQRVGAVVYATAGNDTKREHVANLGVQFITSSRDATVFKEDMQRFLGEEDKLDVVLNSLIGDFIPTALSFLRLGGCFLELGKRGILSKEDMANQRPDVFYETIAVDVMMEQCPAWFGKQLDNVRRLCQEGLITPITLAVYNMASTDEMDGGVAAFQFMQRAKHIGKVIIKNPSCADNFNAKEDCIVITGGLGALGLVVSGWLVEEGVRNLVLLTRQATPIPPGQSPQLDWLQGIVNVNILTCDVSKKADVQKVFSSIQAAGLRIRGVIHGAGVLDDGLLETQTVEKVHRVIEPKAVGAWNLHQVLHEMNLDEDLSFFILFSSVSAVVGNFGQVNYAAANCCLDALAEFRHARRLRCQCIQWGPWIEQGMAGDVLRFLDKAGMKGITNELGLRVLSDAIFASGSHESDPVICCQAFNWRKFLRRYGTDVPSFLMNIERPKEATDADPFLVTKSMTPLERREYIKSHVAGTARQVLGSSISPPLDAPLQELGVDSLGAVEFRNSLSRRLGIKLSATTLFDYPTLNAMIDHIVELVDAAHAAADEGAPGSEIETKSGGGPGTEVRLRSAVKPCNAQEGFAVVGMSCRLPGRSNSPEQFWSMLLKKTDCIVDIPLKRWDVEEFFDEDPDAVGKCFVRQAGFIEDVEGFDNQYFNLSRSEVKFMDPQQRILLEIAAETFAGAFLDKPKLNGANIGVFIGCCNQDWVQLMPVEKLQAFSGTGTASSILANRISYIYGLRGPSFSVDTACSSTLVALDLAREKMSDGSCCGALVGGVNLMLVPHLFIAFCKARMLARDGRCKSFDERADGYGRGEGSAAIFLKPLREARADKNYIWAVLRGTSSNHVGRSASLTAPNGPVQADAVRSALAVANIEPSAVVCVETHGTGTPLGDPIEMGALHAVLGAQNHQRPVIFGAVKTNIGHLEGASGAAGLIKACLILSKMAVPANLHFRKLNPHIEIDPEKLTAIFPTSTVPLAAARGYPVPVVGISSFGFGGANSHAVLEGPPAWYTESLSQGSQGEMGERGLKEAPPLVAFLFTGQGAQYHSMGKVFYENQPVFRDAIQTCSTIATMAGLDTKIESLIYDEPSTDDDTTTTRIDQTLYSQPTTFAIEYALAELWASRGVKPDIVLGHSLGEYVAAVCAGVMSVETAMQLVVARAKIMNSAPSNDGVMAACRSTEEEALEAMATLKSQGVSLDTVAVAAINGPRSIVISGQREQVNKLLVEMNVESRAKFLAVSHAFHSPMMEGPVANKYRSVVAGVTLLSPSSSVKFVSTVLGSEATTQLADHEYWTSHIARPVRFCDAIKVAAELGARMMLEIGPKPTLITMGRQCLPGRADAHTWLCSLTPNLAAQEQLQVLSSVPRSLALRQGPTTETPPVVFARKPFPWKSAPHPLLGAKQTTADGSVTFSGRLRGEASKLLQDHVIQKAAIMPGVGFVELMSSAAGEHFGGGSLSAKIFKLEKIVFERPLLISQVGDSLPPEISISIGADGAVAVVSRREGEDESGPLEHAFAHLRPSPDAAASRISSIIDGLTPSCTTSIESESLYANLAAAGFNYGPQFQTITELKAGTSGAICTLASPDGGPDRSTDTGFRVNPGILDGALQLAAVLVARLSPTRSTLVPFSVEEAYIGLQPASAAVLTGGVQIREASSSSAIVDVQINAGQNQPIAVLKGVTLRQIDLGAFVDIPKELVWEVFFESLSAPATTATQSPPGETQEQPPSPSSPCSEAPTTPKKESEKQKTWIIGPGELQEMAMSLEFLGEVTAFETIEEFTSMVSARIANAATAGDPTPTLRRAASGIEGVPTIVFGLFLDPPKSPEEAVQGLIQLQALAKFVKSQSREARIGHFWILTRHCQGPNVQGDVPPHFAGVWAFCRSVRLELEAASGRRICFGCVDIGSDVPLAVALQMLATNVWGKCDLEENEVIIHKDESADDAVPILEVSRLRASNLTIRGPIEIRMSERGAVSNLSLRPQSARQDVTPPDHCCEIRIRAVGLNFRDVLNVMGLYPGDPGPPGGDFAGTVVALGAGVKHLKIGDPVYGIALGCLKTYTVTDAELVRRMPQDTSFEAAAALPVIAVTVEYSLSELAKVKRGDRVLIHAASGGVGLMAIQHCHRVGATVFATAGSDAKKAYVRSLGVEFVTSSRDANAFKDDMARFLGTAKIDVVLNCLIGDFITHSFEMLSETGRFIELGKRSIWDAETVTAKYPSVMYRTVAVDVEMERNSAWFGDWLERVRDLVERGDIRPIPLELFDMTDSKYGAVAGFRFLQRASHIGKVVLKIPGSFEGGLSDVCVAKQPSQATESGRPLLREALPETKKTVIITGGTGALGCIIAQWFIGEGIGCIILLSKGGTLAPGKPGEIISALMQNETCACRVLIKQCDIASAESAYDTLKAISEDASLPPVTSIIHAAGVLADAMLEDQTPSTMQTVMAPKLHGAWNIHHALDALGLQQQIESFVMFSSVSALIGNFAQSNYAAANGSLDGFVKYRQQLGLPAISLQWGPWTEQGMAAELNKISAKTGLKGLSNELALRVFSEVLRRARQGSVLGIQGFNTVLYAYKRLAAGWNGLRRPVRLGRTFRRTTT